MENTGIYERDIRGFNILKGSEWNQKLINYRNRGALKGKYLGFPNIHKYYSMSLPGVTDWTGFPTSGKSQIVLEFLLNTSLFYGWRHLLYMPDVGTETELLADLLHKYTYKTFDKTYSNLITDEEIIKSREWIEYHFIILYKTNAKFKITPYQFWDYAVQLKKDFNGNLHTATIDAWKDMKHDTSNFARDDKYLEDVLSYRNWLSDHHNLHFHTIIHPLRTKEDKNGNRLPPTAYHLKGGTEWFNNGKNIITIHRPDDGPANIVQLLFHKIKPRSVGQTGMAELYFDPVKFRYFIENGNKRLYAIKNIYDLDVSNIERIDDNDDVPF